MKAGVTSCIDIGTFLKARDVDESTCGQSSEVVRKMEITPNALFHADCIEMIQRVDTESIDLVYLDPPPTQDVVKWSNESMRGGDDGLYQRLQFISRICQHVHRVLKPTGGMFFHLSLVNRDWRGLRHGSVR
jgi:predicted methyltransferase